MAARRDYFIFQAVTEAELDAGFDGLEFAEFNIKADAFSGSAGFIIAGVTVTQAGVPNQTVLVGSCLAWDNLGQRVFKSTTGTVFDFSPDDDPINPRIARLYIKFARALSDPRVDGLGATVNFVRAESFVLERDLGAAAAVPVAPALRIDESILLANITIPAAAGVINNAQITTTIQTLNSKFKVRQLFGATQGLDDAFIAAASASPLPTTANRVALLSDVPAGIAGFMGQNKIVTTGVLAIDIERFDGVDRTAAKRLRLRNRSLTLTGGAGAVNDKDYPGAIAPSSFHYIYAIGDSTLVNPDASLASLAKGAGFAPFTNPTLPAGYDLYRLIGVMLTNGAGTDILPFRQINGEVIYDDSFLANVYAGGLPPAAFTALALGGFVPPIAERAIVGVAITFATSQNAIMEFRSLGGPTVVNYTTLFRAGANDTLDGAVLAADSDWEKRLHVSLTGGIEWRTAAGTVGAHAVRVDVRGFVPDLHYDV